MTSVASTSFWTIPYKLHKSQLSSECCLFTLFHREKWEEETRPPRMLPPHSHRTGNHWAWCSSVLWSMAKTLPLPASDPVIRLQASVFGVSSLSPGTPSSGVERPHLHLNDAWRLRNAFPQQMPQVPLGLTLSGEHPSPPPSSPLLQCQCAGAGLCGLAPRTNSLQHGTTHAPSKRLCYL